MPLVKVILVLQKDNNDFKVGDKITLIVLV